MKILISLFLIVASSTFASSFRVYNYTYKNATQKCAVTIYVPTTGEIKVEKLCFNIKTK